MSLRIVHVAVGVILDRDGNILIARRPDNVHQGGLWEFPGGKVEPGESLFNALARELYEELAITPVATQPLIQIRHDYGDKAVLLDVHKVTEFTGEPKGNEGQPIRWVTPQELASYSFPAANQPIITAIRLPQRLLITGEFHQPQELLQKLERALAQGIRLVQLRMRDQHQLAAVLADVARLCQGYSAQLMLNSSPSFFAQMTKPGIALGLHLNSTHLRATKARPVAADILLGASCHNQQELEHAQKIGVDFICLSPVLATRSHPGQTTMGWDNFSTLVEAAGIPVFALGGMTDEHFPAAIGCGAQGIAAISAWWK